MGGTPVGKTELDKAKEETGLSTIFVKTVPKFGDKSDDVKVLQSRLSEVGGFSLTIDGHFGDKTRDALSAFQKVKGMVGTGILPADGGKTFAYLCMALLAEEKKTEAKSVPVPPWYSFAKKYSGKNEADSDFNKEMSAKWPMLGLRLGTIRGKSAAWCGLAMAVALAGAGISYQKSGSLARNWAKYGVEVDWKKDGIPRGAIIHINHSSCTSGSGNHVTQADGDCTAADLLKSGATINGYGGNQGNAWKVSTYPVKSICAVRWPKDFPMRGKIEKSDKCTSGKSSGSESTR